MNEIDRGLYQSLLTDSLVEQLQELDARLTARKSDLHVEEAPDRLAMHLAKVIHTAIASLNKDKRIEVGGELTQKLIQLLVDSTSTNGLLKEKLALPPRMLKAIDGKKPDGTDDQVTEPLIDLLDTTLLTNANGEPRIGSQIISEIPSAERIDVVMAFIRKSGIRPMMDALRFHRQSGRSLRVLTTCLLYTSDAADE